MSFELKFL